jgi:hypothetical protein
MPFHSQNSRLGSKVLEDTCKKLITFEPSLLYEDEEECKGQTL